MRKILLMPDSFKGSLSSAQASEEMARAVRAVFPACQVVSIPVADGGEGSVDCFLAAMGGSRRVQTVTGPLGEPVRAAYALVDGGETAIVEMAAAAGLPLVGDRRDPLAATTYGVGELVADAVSQGAKKLVVGLGGSATNDGAAGMLAALGVRFFRRDGSSFVPTGGTLEEIDRMDADGLLPALRRCEIVAMCDIDNPMFGPQGAAAVFGPQKGADPAMVERLDRGLRHYSAQLQKWLGQDVSQIPGTGAAGAMGACLLACLGAPLQPGIQVVLDTVHFEELAGDADWVFTGEGSLDCQSLAGKVVIGIAGRAKALGVPVLALCGGCADDLPDLRPYGVTAAFGIVRRPQSLADAMERGGANLFAATREVCKLLAAMEGRA